MAETQNTGQFAKTIVTDVGKDMIAKSQNGQVLTFSRVALGDGLVGEGEDVTKFIAVKNERLSLPIAKYSNLGNGQFQIQFRLTNSQVESGFWHREIGVMAQIDNGEEQLYAYTTAGNKASYIYDKTTPVEERIVNVNFVIGNAQNVEVIINSSVIYATIEDLEEALNAHDAGSNAHEAAFDAHNADETAHKNMVGASSSAAGKRGMVPAPAEGEQSKFLRGDGTWADAKMSTEELVDILYPVGSIYMSTNAANPSTLWSGTTWEAYAQGRVLIGAGTGKDSRNESKTFAAGSTGGEYNHQLTVGEMPAHKHTVTVSLNTAGKHEHTFRAHSGSYTGEHMFYESARDNTSGHEKRNWIDANGNHTHTPTVGEKSIGNNQAHNNIQPYISVYIFRRTK